MKCYEMEGTFYPNMLNFPDMFYKRAKRGPGAQPNTLPSRLSWKGHLIPDPSAYLATLRPWLVQAPGLTQHHGRWGP